MQKTKELIKDQVVELVGEKFTADLESRGQVNRAKFIPIPAGACCPSFIHKFPKLSRQMAALGVPVHFQQGKRDTCLTSSLASALHFIGWEEEANKLETIGQSYVEGRADQLAMLYHIIHDIMPRWLEPKRIRKKEALALLQQQHDYGTIKLCVLEGSDGSKNHAVTIFGNLIFDSNEQLALPLERHALDYCTSTPEQASTYVSVCDGWTWKDPSKKNRVYKKWKSHEK